MALVGRLVFLELNDGSKRRREGVIEEPEHSSMEIGQSLDYPSSSMEDDNDLDSENEINHDLEDVDEILLQETIEYNTILQDEDVWDEGVGNRTYDSSDSWLKQPQEVQSIMNL